MDGVCDPAKTYLTSDIVRTWQFISNGVTPVTTSVSDKMLEILVQILCRLQENPIPQSFVRYREIHHHHYICWTSSYMLLR